MLTGFTGYTMFASWLGLLAIDDCLVYQPGAQITLCPALVPVAQLVKEPKRHGNPSYDYCGVTRDDDNRSLLGCRKDGNYALPLWASRQTAVENVRLEEHRSIKPTVWVRVPPGALGKQTPDDPRCRASTMSQCRGRDVDQSRKSREYST
jgi:hypothetical protein